MQIEIKAIRVLTGCVGPDKVILDTDYPDACWPYTGKMFLSFDAGALNGSKYVEDHFGVKPEVINIG